MVQNDDPRERLVQLGNELLDLMYEAHQLAKAGAPMSTQSYLLGADLGTPEEEVKRQEQFAEAMKLKSKVQHLAHDYLVMRETIEGMDRAKRLADAMPPDPFVDEEASES